MDNKSKLRSLPKIDELVGRLEGLWDSFGKEIVTSCAREQIDIMRKTLLRGEDCEVSFEAAAAAVEKRLEDIYAPHLHSVVNATGVVLHTNLGRAVLAERAAMAAYIAARSYTNLEYDIEKGTRGSRYSHIEKLLCRITGAEAAMVVNNNAAAVLLILSTMARRREVVVSRGELVEIGGAFRVPEIMEQSGGVLVEVGTTNKTHLSDYINAVTENTGAFLKVHTSNFKITGFTEEVSLEDMCHIGHERGIPVIYDLGSGLLCDLSSAGIYDEPKVLEAMKTGVDVLSFSGDKLLGGPQAGIIVGRKQYIEQMKKNPLTRAFRVDKMTFAALEETLRCYLDSSGEKDVPTIAMIKRPIEALDAHAKRLKNHFKGINGLYITVMREKSQVGGGSVPSEFIDTRAIQIEVKGLSAAALEEKLRREHDIICRIVKDKVIFDMRTLLEGDDRRIITALKSICEEMQ
ncbi:MAG: L-seryl-tRNA(Sec) selenium transferase [Clostridiaceae bacterium]|nr:L-seryl-tRNA(Sec) selenium transferase [Clostridiaceae bacterium]